MKRNVGTTTRQIKSLPIGAIFIWCNNDIRYPTNLAVSIGRNDLEIVGVSFLDNLKFLGREFTGFDVDHATEINENRLKAMGIIRTRIRAKR